MKKFFTIALFLTTAATQLEARTIAERNEVAYISLSEASFTCGMGNPRFGSPTYPRVILTLASTATHPFRENHFFAWGPEGGTCADYSSLLNNECPDRFAAITQVSTQYNAYSLDGGGTVCYLEEMETTHITVESLSFGPRTVSSRSRQLVDSSLCRSI